MKKALVIESMIKIKPFFIPLDLCIADPSQYSNLALVNRNSTKLKIMIIIKRIDVIAEALPMSAMTKALVYDSYMSKFVDPRGPPKVIMYTGANIRKLNAVLETRTKEVVLDNKGIVSPNIFCSPLAPSISAAS